LEIQVGVLITVGGLLCTLTGLAIGFLTFNRNRDKDVRNDASESAVIRTKLDSIGLSVDSIRIDLRASEQRWNMLSETVIRVDESTKQAHKRIDALMNKGDA
jgi:hypothetical protein